LHQFNPVKLPKFKSSGVFLDDYAIPCLVAKVRNSDFRGVATRHLARYKRNPRCAIYLRGSDAATVSPWQMKHLDQLLSGSGLAAAINGAMRGYGKTENAYCGATAKERRLILQQGVAPFLTVETIVVDEIAREIIICARTEWDGNLIEHGISIYLKQGRWRFDAADYFARYCEEFPETPFREEVSRKSARRSSAASVSWIESRNRWENLFAVPPAAPTETTPDFLFGDWVEDAKRTREVLALMGNTKSEIASLTSGIRTMRTTWRFTPQTMQMIVAGDLIKSFLLCGCERRGKRVKVFYKLAGGENVLTHSHWHDGDFLIHESGRAYRRN
jgi:hypothetical protein